MLRLLILLPLARLLLAASSKHPSPDTSTKVPTSDSAKNLVAVAASDTILERRGREQRRPDIRALPSQ